MEQKISKVIELLENEFGVPHRRPAEEPLDTLIRTILSQNTTDTNRGRAYHSLRRRFPTWEDVLGAEPAQIAAAIRVGGLAEQKAVRIKALLAWIKENYGQLSLKPICDRETEEVISAFCQLKGVGLKTISVVLCFACGRDIFPVDTHVVRICRRLGLVPEDSSAEKTHRIMNRLLPPGKAYSFHLNLLKFGRTICRARNSRCQICPAQQYCMYFVKTRVVKCGRG
jgi:endonuclease-3